MRPYQNRRLPPAPHAELISNMDEVMEALKANHLDYYVREDDDSRVA